jgi:hypothetical protein
MEPVLVVSQRTNLKHQLFGAWCAPIFTTLTLIGFFGIAHFYKPARADLTPAQAVQWFLRDHRFGVELGMSIWIIATCILCWWVAQLGAMLLKMEGGAPLMAITQIVSGGAIVVIVIIDASLWMGASYRVHAPGEVVQALSDAAWLSLLIAWPILSVQMLATAVVTLHDRRKTPTFPRWLSVASVVGAFALFTAGGPAFDHSGVFAYHGFLGYYLPFIIWAIWLDVHAFYIRRSVRYQMSVLDEGALQPVTLSSTTS